MPRRNHLGILSVKSLSPWTKRLTKTAVHEADDAQHQAAGAKYIAGGFNKAVALSGAPVANRYVVLQFDSVDKAQPMVQQRSGRT